MGKTKRNTFSLYKSIRETKMIDETHNSVVRTQTNIKKERRKRGTLSKEAEGSSFKAMTLFVCFKNVRPTQATLL